MNDTKEFTEVKKKDRVADLDLMRLVLLVFVVLGHAYYYDVHLGVERKVSYNNGGINAVYFNGPLLGFQEDLTAYWIYSFHMPLLFAVSGAVAFLTREKTFASFERLVVAKFTRLIVPYFLYGLLFLLPVRYIAGMYAQGNFASIIRSFLTFSVDGGHLWFLHSLFWCFLIFYPLNLLYRKCNSPALIILVSIAISELFPLTQINILSIPLAILYLPYFALGFAFATYRYSSSSQENVPACLSHFLQNRCQKIVVFVAALAASAILYKAHILGPYAVLANGAWLYLLCKFITDKTKLCESKAFRALNENAIRIYLFHDPLSLLILFLATTYMWMATSLGCYLSYFSRIFLVFGVSFLLSLAVTTMKKHLKNLSRNENAD